MYYLYFLMNQLIDSIEVPLPKPNTLLMKPVSASSEVPRPNDHLSVKLGLN